MFSHVSKETPFKPIRMAWLHAFSLPCDCWVLFVLIRSSRPEGFIKLHIFMGKYTHFARKKKDWEINMDYQVLLIAILFVVIAGYKRWAFVMKRKRRRDYYRNIYLKSDAWKRKRYVVLKRDNWRCVYCGARATQVHHKKYAKRNIGKEPIKWLISVCKSCHDSRHNWRWQTLYICLPKPIPSFSANDTPNLPRGGYVLYTAQETPF